MPTIFQVTTLEGWTDLMYLFEDTSSRWASRIYFVLVIIMTAYFMVSMMLAVVTDSYSRAMNMWQLQTEAQSSIQAAPICQDDVASMSSKAQHQFAELDTDGSGSLGAEEVERLGEWAWCSLHPGKRIDADTRKAEVEKLWQQCDTDGDGKISRREFLVYYDRIIEAIAADQKKKLQELPFVDPLERCPSETVQQFASVKAFETSNFNSKQRKAARLAQQAFGRGLTPARLRKVFDEIDLDGSGTLDGGEIRMALERLGQSAVVVGLVLDAMPADELSFAQFSAMLNCADEGGKDCVLCGAWKLLQGLAETSVKTASTIAETSAKTVEQTVVLVSQQTLFTSQDVSIGSLMWHPAHGEGYVQDLVTGV